MTEISMKSQITNLNRSFVPMQTFSHLNGDPIEEFQREGSVVLKVGPVLRIPMAIQDPYSNNRILNTLVCRCFQVLSGMHICT